MQPKFSIGEIVVIQNQVGVASIYNGVETQILDALDLYWQGAPATLYTIDIRSPQGPFCNAWPYELRRRSTPVATGEQSILALFVGTPKRELEPA